MGLFGVVEDDFMVEIDNQKSDAKPIEKNYGFAGLDAWSTTRSTNSFT